MFPPIEIFNITLHYYPLFSILGILLALLYVLRIEKLNGLEQLSLCTTLVFAGIGAVIGMHLLYGITNFDIIVRLFTHFDRIGSFSNFISILFYIFSGSVYYGGLIGGLISSYVYLRYKKEDVSLHSNLLAPVIPLFHFWGRLGCFFSGCCYGVQCETGFTYSYSEIMGANGVSRFPIQLVEAFAILCIFLLLLCCKKHKKLSKYLLQIYLLSYSVIRFFLEFFRGDEYRGFLWGLSTSQIISLLILLALSIWYLNSKYFSHRSSI